MKSPAVVLLSGGLDSTVNLYMAHQAQGVACAITVDYGQRAFNSELRAARNSCEDLGIEHRVYDLKPIFLGSSSSLIDQQKDLPTGDAVDIESMAQSHETAKSVWVPNRNGVLLNIAASIAETLDSKFVIPGFNLEEAQTFPDNSVDFMAALDKSFFFSTRNQVEVRCFTHKLDKVAIYRKARELDIPEQNIWSCYQDGEVPCGQCESCLRTARSKKAYEASHA